MSNRVARKSYRTTNSQRAFSSVNYISRSVQRFSRTSSRTSRSSLGRRWCCTRQCACHLTFPSPTPCSWIEPSLGVLAKCSFCGRLQNMNKTKNIQLEQMLREGIVVKDPPCVNVCFAHVYRHRPANHAVSKSATHATDLHQMGKWVCPVRRYLLF